jgi:hypothetical protein
VCDVYDPTVPQPSDHSSTLLLPPRQRRGRVIAFVVGLVALGCCVAGLTASLVGQALRNGVASPTGDPTPGIGAAVRDGQFAFVVSAVTCGHTEIVNGILRAQAQGQYCVVEMSVSNTGDEPRHFADGNQKAFGPGGQQFAADTNAGVVANGSGAAVWNVINPGNWVEAKVVFDVPTTVTVAVVELHDSALSGGVRVAVSRPATATAPSGGASA